MTDFRIRVVVDPAARGEACGDVDNSLNRTQRLANQLQNTFRRLFAGLSTVIAVRQVGLLADSYTRLQNRVRVVTNSQRELASVTSELFRVANDTRTAFDATAEVYARTALAAEELGISQREVLQFTESLNQAVTLSGAGAQEARAGLIQFAQGLGSQQLRGEELKSVLEQIPVVADVIAQSLGVTRSEFRELGFEGKITADVILRAFRESREELAERFGRTIPTVGQAFTILRNQVTQFIGELDQSNGVTRAISAAIITLSQNLGTFARIIATVGVALGVRGLVGVVRLLVTQLGVLRVALLTNPLTALVSVVPAAIGLLVAFGDRIRATRDGIASLQDVFVATFQVVREIVTAFVNLFDTSFPAIGETIS